MVTQHTARHTKGLICSLSVHGLFIVVVLRYDFTPGLTAQKSLDVISVAPKFIHNFGLGYDPLGPLFIAWPLDFEGRSVGKTEKWYFLGATAYRLRVESLLCNWILLWWFYAAQLSHAHSISLYPILLAKTLAWSLMFDLNTVFLWCFYGSSWLGTTSSFRLGRSVLHGFLLTSIVAFESSHCIKKMQVRSQEGQIPQIFWCEKSM